MNSVIFYNRIPKTGSTTFTNAIAYDLCSINKFHAIHLNLTKNNYIMNLIDQAILIRNITSWTALVPAFYHGHAAFIDFTRFGYANPVYINLVREPLDRLISHYYFLRYGDNYRVGLKRSRAGNNETFDECIQKEGKDCDPKQMWLQVPYFCGTASFCSEAGNPKALEMAKWNLVNRYLLVGLTERMEDMIALMEQLLPSFFSGALSHFKSLNDHKKNLRHTLRKIMPSEEVLGRIKQTKIYRMEREFYEFASAEFDNTWKRVWGPNDKLLTNQFHYEKIRP
ncbi:sulfotransferase family domain-containing protein [Ditylenchus destructor]|uniref:Sulfotransferase family domain-containing protein n=1 Tax=Ditylenchus destructor TaxID=166010 RepID=A0AAD4N9E7_9BILA|nr:sulfotransferase family domain-containing protein [Ditylenchus destructor]